MAKGSLPTSRPPLARMMRIHETLQDGHFTNCTKLAKALEVSKKTIMRDLAFMRDQLDLPVEYDAPTYSWRYIFPVKSFPTVQVSEGELLALLVAQKALEQYKGTPYHDQLAHAFDKLSEGLKDKVSFSATGSLGSVSFHKAGWGRTDMKIFERLSRAVMQGVEIEFDYRKPQSTATESRRVQPYHLANRENTWYLVGFDLDRQAIRNFSVIRMQSMTLTNRKYTRPADFSPEKHFAKAFGAYVGTGNHKVVVRFRPEVAGKIKERFWHESQESKDLSDGRVEITMYLDSLDEILAWILGWRAQAEVIGPKELVQMVRQAADEIRKLY